MTEWLLRVRDCFRSDQVLYSRHARSEMAGEEFGEVSEHDVCDAVLRGEVIEEYPEDKPYPSRLIFGTTAASRPLHVLCAHDADDNLAIVITVYHPNPEMWIDNKRRKMS